MISLSDIRLTYPAAQRPALEGVSLSVGQGEFVSVVGASGCGKSSLLNVVAGLDRPESGSVEVEGDIALIFQDPALFPWLTAIDNVALALHDKGMRRRERRAEASNLLRLVGLAEAGDKRPHELSGGMRQRVAIARALARGANVLLMDEPFSALDAITRDALHGELSTLWKERGLTVLFVTHNVREAVTLGQRVVLMGGKPGRIERVWTVDEGFPRDSASNAVHEIEREITESLRNLMVGMHV
jgi:NitT/TauT family transport system ATP-binding protein